MNYEQFKVDPLPDPNELILVPAGWLQKTLREHEQLLRHNKRVDAVNDILNDKIAFLRMQLSTAQAETEYRTLNVKA
jgi:hypothetical protein